MADWVWDNLASIPTKANKTTPTSSVYEYRAEDSNVVKQAIEDIRATLRNGVIKDVGATALSGAGEARLRVSGGALQVSVDGSAFGPLQGGVPYVIDVTQAPYNCKGDGTTDDTTGLQNAVIAAGIASALGLYGVVYLPAGKKFAISKPIYVGPGVHIQGDGFNVSQVCWLASGFGPTFIFGVDHNAAPYSNAWYLTSNAFSGGLAGLHQVAASPGSQRFLDITQCYRANFGNGSWNVKFKFKITSAIAAGQYQILQCVGGNIASGTYGQADVCLEASSPIVWQVVIGSTTGSDLYADVHFRYKGIALPTTVAIGGTTKNFVPGTEYEMCVSWDATGQYHADGTAHTGVTPGTDGGHTDSGGEPYTGGLRVYVDGVRWSNNNGVVVPAANNSWKVNGVTRPTHQFPWERWTIGAGCGGQFPVGTVSTGYIDSTIGRLAFYNVAETGSSYSVSHSDLQYNTTGSNANLELGCNFNDTHKDCMVFWSGTLGRRVYIRAHSDNVETGGCSLRDLRLVEGTGIICEFASTFTAENIQHTCFDGWVLRANGYFSRFRNISINGNHRAAIMSEGGSSYIGMDNIQTGGAIGYAFNSCNVVLTNCSASMHTDAVIGFMLHGQGTYQLNMCQLDAEESAPDFVTGFLFEDPQSLQLNSCSFNTPPSAPAKSPLLMYVHTADAPAPAVVIVGGLYTKPAGTGEVILSIRGDGSQYGPQRPTPTTAHNGGVAIAQKVVRGPIANTNGTTFCDDMSSVTVL
jgi:hypothetical protein